MELPVSEKELVTPSERGDVDMLPIPCPEPMASATPILIPVMPLLTLF